MDEAALFVCCTRGSKEDTELFRSLSSLGTRWDTLFFENNSAGLSARYNWVLDRPDLQDRLIVFAHDDLRISDPDIVSKVTNTPADIIGLAGSGAFTADPGKRFLLWTEAGEPHLSGLIGHASSAEPFRLALFGPSPRRCIVIDGVFMAMRPRALKGVRFDERFTFHFYDLDFCLTATEAGIAISTTGPAGAVHYSQGEVNIHSAAFLEAQRLFLAKWQGRSFQTPL